MNTLGEQRVEDSRSGWLGRRIVLTLATLFLASLGLSIPVQATAVTPSPTPKTIERIQVQQNSPDGQYTSTLTLDLDSPVDARTAAELKQQVGSAAPATGAARLGPVYLSCGGSGNWSDNNGTLSLQYTCTSKYVIAWGFRFSAAAKAIIVGNVNETGLRWWRSGTPMPQNAPHVVPDTYIFHGSMTGATLNKVIDYQDYMTFRHNVGPGGTGSITWAGRVTTLRD